MTRIILKHFVLMAGIVVSLVGSSSAMEVSKQTYLENGLDGRPGSVGQFVAEAEIYHSKTADTVGSVLHQWEFQNSGTPINFRGTGFMQVTPDLGLDTATATANPESGRASAGQEGTDPLLNYVLKVETPGTYQLYARFDDPASNAQFSDSMYVHLLDPTLTPFTDFYQMSKGGLASTGGDFSDDPWHGLGRQNLNAGGADADPVTWTIATPGDYTLQFSFREDGVSLDAFVFQLSSLAAPTGLGPNISSYFEDVQPVPEPSSLMLLALGVIGLARHSRRLERRA